jgi:hypothetical protein
MEQSPEDFAVRYDWCAGSMPPPYHYEYTIRIGPGPVGEVVFSPDYPGQDAPVWTEGFDVNEAALDALYHLVADRVLGREFAKVEDGPVGGSLAWMSGTVGGEPFRVPTQIEEPERVEPVYAAIKELVPRDLWDSLLARREQYERDYEG